MKSRGLAIVMVGLAWPFFGVGFLAIHFRYVPLGAELIGTIFGLFLAGCVSGAAFLALRAGLSNAATRGLLAIGYVVFAPVGLLAGLLAPATLADLSAASGPAYILAAPMFITLYSSLVVGIGLLTAAGLAQFTRSLAAWREIAFESKAQAVPVAVRVRN